MFKHLVQFHHHHPILETFDDFYSNDSKSIKSPTSLNSYTFHNVFGDLTSDIVPEEDEQTNCSTPIFYLEDDLNTQSSRLSNSFKYSNTLIKQNSVNENELHLTKLRTKKTSSIQRSQTINTNIGIIEKQINSKNDSPIVKKHRSFVSLFRPNITGIFSLRKKSSSIPILSKITSLFHRNSNQSHGVQNFITRFRHRSKLARSLSNELIQKIKESEEKDDYTHLQRSFKPVVMKRVHTCYNTFQLRSLDQCLEY
jgi:hypothetical protein